MKHIKFNLSLKIKFNLYFKMKKLFYFMYYIKLKLVKGN